MIAAVAASVIVLAAYKCLGETAPTPVVEEKFSVSVKEDTTLEPDAPTAASFVGLEDYRRFKCYDMSQIELTGKIKGTDKEAYTVEWTELRHIGNDCSVGLSVPMTTTEKPELERVVKDGTLPFRNVRSGTRRARSICSLLTTRVHIVWTATRAWRISKANTFLKRTDRALTFRRVRIAA